MRPKAEGAFDSRLPAQLLKVLTSHPNQEKFFFLNNILT
jgi:hypothetical protein